jgi:thiosulfate reductase cytochrome b subunit
MKHVLEYCGTLLHLVGMFLLVGGHIWFGFLTAMTERYKDREGARFLARHLPLMANVFGIGILLLFGSGVLRLLVWGEPGLIFLPDPYGWLLLSKLVLYMLIVINGALIERRYLPYVLQERQETTGTALHLTAAWSQVKVRARLNLLLVLIVVALGEALRYSRL